MDKAQCDRLVHLWNIRHTFKSDRDWVELYQLVGRLLRCCYTTQPDALRETREFLVQGFFIKKAFETAGRNSPPLTTCWALCGWFRNYLNDGIRSNRSDPLSKAESADEERQFSKKEDEPDANKAEPNPSQDAIDCELTLEAARRSAREFLSSLGDSLCIVLARSYCADQGEKQGAIQLAEELGIPSPGYRLGQLGVTKRHGGGRNPDFASTDLGRWIASLGVDLNDAQCIKWLLIQLCHEATAKDQEEGQP